MANRKRTGPRSLCPINRFVETFGDPWSLIVLRDIMFGGRRHYLDLLENSEEGISTSVLVDRLKKLTHAGVIQQIDDTTHKQRTLYALTESGIELAPAVVELSKWSAAWQPPSTKHAVRTRILTEGGENIIARLIDDLKVTHLGHTPTVAGLSVLAELQKAYDHAGEPNPPGKT